MTNDLPPGWAWTEFGSITNTQLGKMLSARATRGHRPRPYLRNQNVQWHHFNLSDVAKMDFFDTEAAKYELRPGDLLVCEGGEVGRCAVWSRPHSEMYFQKALHRVRPLAGIRVGWIEYFLRWSAETGRFGDHTSGSTISHLPQRDLRRLHVPVPPTPEQDRIVAAIEEHFSRLDAVELGLQRGLQQLDTLKSAVLVEAFHANRGLPSHWNWTTIGEVAEVRGGIQKQPKRRPNKNPAPFLRVANVLRGELLLDEVHQIELFDGELQRYRLQAGDLLVVEGNGSPHQIGRAACWEGEIADCVHQNHLIRVRPGPKLVPKYLALYWNAPHTASVLREVASSTSGLYTLSTTKVKSIPVPLAPLPEQQRIAEEVDQQLETHTRLEQSIRHALDRLRAVRRSILALAFSGQLMAQDPDDEPASVLLERVAASRTAKPDRQKGDARAAARSR